LPALNYWEAIPDNLRKGGLKFGWVSVIDSKGVNDWIIVRADEILTAFREAERAVHQFDVSLLS